MKFLKFVVIIFSVIFFSGCNLLGKDAKSGLQVITDSAESSVFLNDQYIEKTPFINREIKPGDYILKIQPDDQSLVAYETKITLRPGLLTVVTWKLASRPELSGGVIYEMEPISAKNQSEVSFVTIPDGAIIAMQGKDKEFSPTIISNVNPGHNEFEVSLPSYESQKHTINVAKGYRMLVNIKLAKIGIDQDSTEKIDTESPDSESSKSGELNVLQENEEDSTQEAEEIKTQVIIDSTNFFINGEEVLKVRDNPKSTAKELGFAKVGEKYPYLGTTTNGWLNISFEDSSGWVSGTYAKISKK